MNNSKLEKRLVRKKRIKSRIHGTSSKPRLVVFRSLRYTQAQLIDDDTHTTIASSIDKKIAKKGTKVEKAAEVGKDIAEKAKSKKIESVVFDRNGFKYHGRVKAVAEAARESGLNF